MANNVKKIENANQSSIIKIIKGSITAILLSLILLVILALLLAYTNVPESIITPTIIVISALSILIGSFISSIKIKKPGIINGGIVGGIYIITLYILSSMVQKDFGINTYAIIMIISSILAGCVGGVVGVNMKK